MQEKAFISLIISYLSGPVICSRNQLWSLYTVMMIRVVELKVLSTIAALKARVNSTLSKALFQLRKFNYT